MSKQIVLVDIKQVYGNETIYPVNILAHSLAALAGTKTLTRHAINIIRGMPEFEIQVSQAAVIAKSCELNAAGG